MIAPLMPMAMRGVIWYQGESNLGDGMKYFGKMTDLITGWRRVCGAGRFPFLLRADAQLRQRRRFAGPAREAQAATLAVPNTGMAVTIDIGSYPDCHCPKKQEVGKRLALWALAKTYGRKELVYSGPLYRAMQIEGQTIRIRFDHTGSGLATRDGSQDLTCFEIAATDGRFIKTMARIDGDSVLVSSPRRPSAGRRPLRVGPTGSTQPDEQGRVARLNVPQQSAA